MNGLQRIFNLDINCIDISLEKILFEIMDLLKNNELFYEGKYHLHIHIQVL